MRVSKVGVRVYPRRRAVPAETLDGSARVWQRPLSCHNWIRLGSTLLASRWNSRPHLLHNSDSQPTAPLLEGPMSNSPTKAGRNDCCLPCIRRRSDAAFRRGGRVSQPWQPSKFCRQLANLNGFHLFRCFEVYQGDGALFTRPPLPLLEVRAT